MSQEKETPTQTVVLEYIYQKRDELLKRIHQDISDFEDDCTKILGHAEGGKKAVTVFGLQSKMYHAQIRLLIEDADICMSINLGKPKK